MREYKKKTLYIPLKLYELIDESVEKTRDITGFCHMKMNTWILLAIKEKIDRERTSL